MPKPQSFEEAFEGAKKMSERYVEKGPYLFFPLPEIVEEVQGGLAKNELEYGKRYCP